MKLHGFIALKLSFLIYVAHQIMPRRFQVMVHDSKQATAGMITTPANSIVSEIQDSVFGIWLGLCIDIPLQPVV